MFQALQIELAKSGREAEAGIFRLSHNPGGGWIDRWQLDY